MSLLTEVSRAASLGGQAAADFAAIRAAIVEKGVDVPDGTPTYEYAALIGQIEGGGDGEGDYIRVSPAMTNNNMPSPYVVSASSSHDNNFQPWRAMDGRAYASSDPDGWSAAVGAFNTSTGLGSAWWKLYYGAGSGQVVNRIVIINRLFSSNNIGAAVDFTFEASNDNSAWATLLTVTDRADVGTAQSTTYNFTNNTPYLYYRISVTRMSLPSTSGSGVKFGQVLFFQKVQ